MFQLQKWSWLHGTSTFPPIPAEDLSLPANHLMSPASCFSQQPQIWRNQIYNRVSEQYLIAPGINLKNSHELQEPSGPHLSLRPHFLPPFSCLCKSKCICAVILNIFPQTVLILPKDLLMAFQKTDFIRTLLCLHKKLDINYSLDTHTLFHFSIPAI